MRLAITALALCCADAFVRPSATRHSALKATGDRWYCGEGVKYPRGAAGMPPAPPPETGGYSHEPQLFEFWADTNYDYEVALARPLGIVFEEIGLTLSNGTQAIHVCSNVTQSEPADLLVGQPSPAPPSPPPFPPTPPSPPPPQPHVPHGTVVEKDTASLIGTLILIGIAIVVLFASTVACIYAFCRGGFGAVVIESACDDGSIRVYEHRVSNAHSGWYRDAEHSRLRVDDNCRVPR